VGDWNALPEGPYQVYIYANDTYGYLNDTLGLTLYKDINNPTVFIHSIDNNSYHNTAPSINVSFSDFNYDSLWYEILGIPYILQNNTDHELNAGAWGSLGQGQFTVFIFANDTGGNLNNTYRFVFYKDTVAPSIEITFPVDGTHFTTAPVITINVIDPNLHSTWYQFEGVKYDFVSGVNEQIDTNVWSGLAEGVYYIFIYANDTFGQINTIVLTIHKDASSTSGPSTPPFDPIFLIIFLIILAIAIIGALGFIKSRGKKEDSQGLAIKAKRKTTSDFKKTPAETTPKPKLKPKVATDKGDILTPGELAAIQEETKKTRDEMLIEEKEDVCPVHKGTIVGILYACPKCKTKYCMKCARTLIQNKEGCWICNEPISFMDEDLT